MNPDPTGFAHPPPRNGRSDEDESEPTVHLIQKVLLVLGGLAVLVGALWIGQGAGIIPGSFMTGDRTWLGIGLAVAAVGLMLVFVALQRPRPRWAERRTGRGPKPPSTPVP